MAVTRVLGPLTVVQRIQTVGVLRLELQLTTRATHRLGWERQAC